MHSSDKSGITHLTAGQVAAYLDRTLPDPERSAVESHLAECVPCRQELVGVRRSVRVVPHWRRWYTLAPLAAAAAAAVIVVGVGRAPWGGTDVVRTAAPPDEGVLRYAAVAPRDSATVSPEAVVFTWHSAGAEGTYRLQVTTPGGSEVWTLTTADTTAVLPREVVPERGQAYFWSVDALLPDGGTATTGWREFRTPP